MTRFGVMKHLTRARGRAPGGRLAATVAASSTSSIRCRSASSPTDGSAAMRAPLVDAMADIKHTVEKRAMAESPKHVYEVYIRATPGGGLARAHRFGADEAVLLRQHGRVGLEARLADGVPRTPTAPRRSTCEIVEADAPRQPGPHVFLPRHRRVAVALHLDGRAARRRRPPDLTHDEFDGETSTFRVVAHGWRADPLGPQDAARDRAAVGDQLPGARGRSLIRPARSPRAARLGPARVCP